MTDSNSLLQKTLGTCTLECLLSQGGMGTVYLARQLRPRRTVAIKVLLPGSVFKAQAQADFLARFRREADAIAALDHIHIMPIYEYGEQDQLAYLVMPYVTGGTLREILIERGALPLSKVLPILEQAAEALDYAHERGIIHRDIKPGNMLFHADGRLLLTDFGLAKLLDQTGETFANAFPAHATLEREATQALPFAHLKHLISPTTQAIALGWLKEEGAEMTRKVNQHMSSMSSETVIGTPEYLAPERALGQPVDRRADIYSLGIVLFQMLTGQLPFAGSSAISTAIMHTEDKPPRPSILLPGLAPEIEAVILRSIAKNPMHRYNTAGDFARALREAAKYDTAVQGTNASLHPYQNSRHGYTALPKTALHIPKQIIIERQTPPPQAQSVSGVRNAVVVVLCSLLILVGIFASLAQGSSMQHPISTHTHKTPMAQPTKQPIVIPTIQPTAIPSNQ
ncbi:MAG: protein kinase [Ktedonobacteraceae bacterium]